MAEANVIPNYFKPTEATDISRKKERPKQGSENIFARSIKRKFSELCEVPTVEGDSMSKNMENTMTSISENDDGVNISNQRIERIEFYFLYIYPIGYNSS